MSERRCSSVKQATSEAAELPKSVELEQRVSRTEIAVKKVQDEVEVLNKRVVAVQAQVDHVTARRSQ
jgi:hypothetical protein